MANNDGSGFINDLKEEYNNMYGSGSYINDLKEEYNNMYGSKGSKGFGSLSDWLGGENKKGWLWSGLGTLGSLYGLGLADQNLSMMKNYYNKQYDLQKGAYDINYNLYQQELQNRADTKANNALGLAAYNDAKAANAAALNPVPAAPSSNYTPIPLPPTSKVSNSPSSISLDTYNESKKNRVV